MKKLQPIVYLFLFSSIVSVAFAQNKLATVRNNQLEFKTGYFERILTSTRTDSTFIMHSSTQKKMSGKVSSYSKESSSYRYFLKNLNNKTAHFDKRTSSSYEPHKAYGVSTRLRNDFSIPAVQDGFYVDNDNDKIYTPNGELWLSFSEVEDLINGSKIGSHKKLQKLDKKRILWVSNFYKGKALVAMLNAPTNYLYSDILFLGYINSDKTFTALEKPVAFDAVPRGIYPSGYLVFGSNDKRKVYDSNLKSVSSKTFIPWLDAKDRVNDKSKGYVTFYRSSEVVQQINKEGYVLVGKSPKKLSKNKQSLINYSDLEGNLLFKNWIVTDRSAKREFRNANVVLFNENEWLEIDTKGETTFKFPKDVIMASHFVNEKAFIQTEKGLAIINKSGKVLTPYRKELYLKPSSGFWLNNGFGVVSRVEDERDVVVDEALNIVVENNENARLTYYNDSLMLAYFEKKKKKYTPKDYSKELPDVNKLESRVGSFSIYVSSGFIPDKTGYLMPGTKEQFFVQNFETFEHDVSVTFTYEVTTGGSVRRTTTYYKTFTVKVPPNEVRVINPSSLSLIKLNAYDDYSRKRNFRLSYKVDGKPQ